MSIKRHETQTIKIENTRLDITLIQENVNDSVFYGIEMRIAPRCDETFSTTITIQCVQPDDISNIVRAMDIIHNQISIEDRECSRQRREALLASLSDQDLKDLGIKRD